MLFNSYVFVAVFLPCVLLGFHGLLARGRQRSAIAWLVAASLFFYGWWKPDFVLLLLASMAFNFALGRVLGHERGRRRWVLGLGVGGNLALIGYFKYANFAAATANRWAGSEFALDPIVLPLAISFFTFQQIAYLVDTYRGNVAEVDPLHYALFVTFFPQLIAGPIVHHAEMIPQFADRSARRVPLDRLAVGVTLFVMGLFKKVVVADGMARWATPVFEGAGRGAALAPVEAWGGAIAYAFQIYFDFSGYSDMAIGLGALFGIRLPLNFDSPYQATNIIDFWRRWHMTLSRFLRDYLYIPLGGSRRGESRRLANLMITMLLGGLWHGAGFRFLIWGGLHGLFLVTNHLWRRYRPGVSEPSRIARIASQALTLLCVVVAWVFFRANDVESALHLLAAMLGIGAYAGPDWNHFDGAFQVAMLSSVAIWVVCAPNAQQWFGERHPALEVEAEPIRPLAWPSLAWRPSLRFSFLTATVAAVSLLSFVRESEFIYFQF